MYRARRIEIYYLVCITIVVLIVEWLLHWAAHLEVHGTDPLWGTLKKKIFFNFNFMYLNST